jgi:hypothetical protein
MKNHAYSNVNGNSTKPTIVKVGSTFTYPKLVLLPPVNDLQSSLCLPNRPRFVSLEFHSSPRRLPLGLAPSPSSSPFNAELRFLPRTAHQNKDEMYFTPASSFEKDIWMPCPLALEGKESTILPSPIMPRELFIPDDF